MTRFQPLALIALAIGLSACAPTTALESRSSTVDPMFENVVAPEYESVRLQRKSLVVVAPRIGQLDDKAGIRRHVAGESPDLDEAFAAFAQVHLQAGLVRVPAFSEVARPTLEQVPENFMAPDPGTTFSFNGAVPDVLLFVDSLSVHRGTRSGSSFYTPGVATPGGTTPGVWSGGGSSQSLVAEARYLFWDNKEGRPIQHGVVMSEENLQTAGTMRYEAVITKLAQQMVKRGPFRGTRR